MTKVKIIAVLIAIAAAIASLVAIGTAIDHAGYARAQQTYELKIAKDKKSAADALRVAEAKASAKNAADQASVLNLTERLMTANSTIDVQNVQLKARANNVSTTYRPAPAAPLVAVPAWIVTFGWLCDYDRAIGYGMQETGPGLQGNVDAACAADPFAPSGVTGEQILKHHEDYAAYARRLEGIATGLVSYAGAQQEDAP